MKTESRLRERIQAFAPILVTVVAALLAQNAAAGVPLDISEIRNLRVDISASNCDGSDPNIPEVASKTAYVRGGEPGVTYSLEIVVGGLVEGHHSGYDLVYLNGEFLFGGDNDEHECVMHYKTATTKLCVKSGDAIELLYATVDGRWHSGASANVISVRASGDCGSGAACDELGQVQPSVSSMDIVWNLGRGSFGESVGNLYVHADAPTISLPTPAALEWSVSPSNSTVDVVEDVDGFHQLRVPQGLAQATTNSPFEYELEFFYDKDVLDKGTNGVYGIAQGGEAFVKYTIANPSGSTNDTDELALYTTRGGSTATQTFVYASSPESWSLVQGERSGRRTLKRTVAAGGTNVTTIVYDAATNVVSEIEETYEVFAWGTQLVESVKDPDGAALSYEWLYDENSSTNRPGYQHLAGRKEPFGYWETYSHEGTDFRLGVLSTTKVAYLDAAYDAEADSCRTLAVDVTEDTPFDATMRITRSFESLENHEVRREFCLVEHGAANCYTQTTYRSLGTYAYWHPSFWQMKQTNACLVEVKTYEDDELIHTKHYDGTVSRYAYDGESTKTTTMSHGEFSGATLTNGEKRVTAVDAAGHVLTQQVFEVVDSSTEILVSQTVGDDFDDLGRWETQSFLDGTEAERQFACCGVDRKTSRQAVQTFFYYDELGRQDRIVHDGVTTKHQFDPLDRVVCVERVATGGVDTVFLSSNVYNVAGQLTSSFNSGSEETVYTTTETNGHRFVSVSYPDGGTRCEEYYADGRLHKVWGSAVTRDLLYEYDVVSLTNTWLYGNTATEFLTTNFLEAVTTTVLSNGVKTGEARTDYVHGWGRTLVSKEHGSPDALTTNIYNTFDQLRYVIGPEGTVEYVYDGRGRLAREIRYVDGSPGNVTTSDVVLLYATTVYTNAAGTFRSDEVARLDADGSTNTASVTVQQLDALSRWQIAGGLTNRIDTTIVYSNLEQRVTATSPDGNYAVSVSLDGKPVSSEHRNSASNLLASTTRSYDDHGRLSKVEDELLDTEVVYTYGDDDTLAQLVTATGATLGYGYDEMLRQTAVTNSVTGTAITEYNPDGTVAKRYGGRQYPVDYAYDYAARMREMTTYQQYATQGGAADTVWEYDPYHGRPKEKRYEGNTNGVEYAYSLSGRLTGRVWQRGNSTTYQYTPLGQLTSVVYSDGTPSISNQYNRLGERDWVSDDSGTRTLAYEEGRLTEVAYSAGDFYGIEVARDLDEAGRLGGVSVTSGAAQVYGVQYGYDGAGRLAAVTNGSVGIAYAYNSTNGMIETITSSLGGTNILVLGKVYDAYRRLLSSTATTTSQVDAYAYSYDQAGTRTDMTTGSGLLWSYAYDDLGQLTNAVATLSAQPVPGRAYAYAYDTIGNRTSAVQNEEAFGYAANLLNQYTNVTSPGVAQVLGVAATNATVTADFVPAERLAEHYLLKIPFDNSSGLVYDTVTVTGVVNNVNVSNEDAVASASVDLLVPPSARTLSYDLDGNLTEDGLRKYTWNGENRLVKVVPTAALAAALPANLVSTNTYRYDSEGRMTERSVCSGTGTNVTRFVYDGWLLLAELDGSNDVIRSYVWGADLSGSFQGAGGVGGLLAVVDHTDGVVEYFPVYDGNGNVMALIDSRDRTMAAQYEYDPFGKIIRQTGDFADDNPFRFSTKYHDDETGLVYYGLRSYSPGLGRWASRDPIAERGAPSLYLFVENTPLSATDILGMVSADGCTITTTLIDSYSIRQDSTPFEKGVWVSVHHEQHFDEVPILLPTGYVIVKRPSAFTCVCTCASQMRHMTRRVSCRKYRTMMTCRGDCPNNPVVLTFDSWAAPDYRDAEPVRDGRPYGAYTIDLSGPGALSYFGCQARCSVACAAGSDPTPSLPSVVCSDARGNK